VTDSAIKKVGPRAPTPKDKQNLRGLLRAAGGREQLVAWIDQIIEEKAPTRGAPRKTQAILVDAGPAIPDGNLKRLELIVDGKVFVLFYAADLIAKREITANLKGKKPAKVLSRNMAVHRALTSLLKDQVVEALSPEQKQALFGNSPPEVVATRLLRRLQKAS
jgi:hypothetical protein